jgi:hypothetical protein
MRTINVTFEDSEISLIDRAKDVLKAMLDKEDITWHEFILLGAKEVLNE